MLQFNPDKEFDTSQWYAIFSGWLIVPILVSFMGFLGALIMLIFVNPKDISGIDLAIYYGDISILPVLLAAFIFMFMRKRYFPYLMIAYFLITGTLSIVYYMNGLDLNVINVFMAVVWIGYFIRSERVKVTFTK